MSTYRIYCARCRWPVHIPVEQARRTMCRACETRAASTMEAKNHAYPVNAHKQ